MVNSASTGLRSCGDLTPSHATQGQPPAQPPPSSPHPHPNPTHTPTPTPTPPLSRCPALTVSMILTCVIGLLADPCPADQAGRYLPVYLRVRACVRARLPPLCTHTPHTHIHIHIWIRWQRCGPRCPRCTGATARASTKPQPSGRASMRSRRVAPRDETRGDPWLPHESPHFSVVRPSTKCVLLYRMTRK